MFSVWLHTPFLAVKMDGGWGRWLLLYVWVVAGLGVALKLIWVKRFERLSVMLYLFLGWTILVAIEPLAASASLPAIVLLAAGGIQRTRSRRGGDRGDLRARRGARRSERQQAVDGGADALRRAALAVATTGGAPAPGGGSLAGD
jgi:hypothetical protein